MRNLDLSSWQSILTTLASLLLVTLIGVGVRLLTMMTIQARRERVNRQINERLRTLIAAYKTLGGSFTGDLAVDPTHLGDLRRRGLTGVNHDGDGVPDLSEEGSDRARRTRDAVEAALSDVILLGTEPQVRLAERAARELVGGARVHVHELVVSLRDYVREALDLDPVPSGLAIPRQGPTRPSSASARGKGGRDEGARQGTGGSGGGSGGGMGGGGGGGMGGGDTDTSVGLDDPDKGGERGRNA